MHLILNNYGSSLQAQGQNFIVLHPGGKQSVHATKVHSISLQRGARISSDAALLAIEHEVEILFVDRSGKPAGRLWSVKYGSISTIRKQQLAFTASADAVAWVVDLITAKLNNQLAFLLSLQSTETEAGVQRALRRITDYRNKVQQAKGNTVADVAASLRGWEGAASKAYFEAIAAMLPEGMRFEKRTQHPAYDVFNMLLNYGYGMLYGKVEGALIRAGIDPYLGIMHRDEHNRPVLAYDVIERYRVWIDYVVVSLAMQQVIDADCYSVENAAFWLEPMGKRILIQSVNDYLDEVILQHGVQRSRAEHILRDARQLATFFKDWKPSNTPE